MTTAFLTFLLAQMVKNPLAMKETWVRSLGWEDPLEKGMAAHSSILAWRKRADKERTDASLKVPYTEGVSVQLPQSEICMGSL